MHKSYISHISICKAYLPISLLEFYYSVDDCKGISGSFTPAVVSDAVVGVVLVLIFEADSGSFSWSLGGIAAIEIFI